jgi:cysteine desulfurase
MHVNNETGAVHDVKRLRSLLPKVLLHTDAVQSLGKVPFRVDELGVDFATISAHKINGPKGVGAMFIKRGIDFKAYQQGGGQERNRRAGTEPVAQIVGFQHAVRYAMAEFARRTERMATMRLLLLEGVRKEIPDIRINTPENAAPHVLNISFLDAERLDGEAILQLMDIRGVAVSNGSACVSGSLQPSHVLLAMGLPAPEAKAAVRFSVGHQTSEEEVRTAVTILADIVRAMRVETR